VLAVEIRTVDVFDDAAVAAWHASKMSTLRHDREDPVYWSLRELALALRDPNAPRRTLLLTAQDGDTVVGTGFLLLPTRDNLTLSEIDIQVEPACRREGVGSALFDKLRAAAIDDGRASVIGAIVGPYDGTPVPPGVPFAESFGLTFRNEEVRRRLKLPIPADRLRELLDSTMDRRDGYQLEHWEGACPDRYAEQYAALMPLLSTEAPVGDLEFEPEQYDVKRMRDGEALSAAQGLRVFTTIALGAGGAIVGHTQLAVPSPAEDPAKAHQWATLVRREHRGHRLGLALKAQNHLAAQEAIPDLDRTIHTWNARQNRWMISVNEQLGYRPVDTFMEFQGDLKV
jgi:GNAT superfamily N-acetyltransferase